VNAVTDVELMAAATTYLHPQQLTTLVVGDHAKVGESLGGLGLGPVEVLPVP